MDMQGFMLVQNQYRFSMKYTKLRRYFQKIEYYTEVSDI